MAEFFYKSTKACILGIPSICTCNRIYLSLSIKSFFFHNICKKIFSYDTWCSTSLLRADYMILFLNSLVMVVLSPRLLSKSIVAFTLYYYLSDFLPLYSINVDLLDDWQLSLLFTLCLFIANDFSKYWVHRWLHTVSFLWPFHRIHHSATTLNFFTVFRTHPIEAVLFSLRNAIVQGIIVGIFFFTFGNQVTLMMILGANAFGFLFNILGSNLRHSPVALPYPRWLERYLMSPAQHHIHHSYIKEHKDKNYGVVISCWDRWFGSFHHSEKKVSYGLSSKNEEKEHQLIQIYVLPFYSSYKRIKSKFIRD